MARKQYSVRVRYEQERELTVWAEGEDAACEAAYEIVEGWKGVLSATAAKAEEI